ncbi:oligopeptide transport system permease OppB [Nitratireductor aquibiodomus RA22]|uniref:Peptide/nickel transport system permease protein n=2 Tax=Nitratireductor aquibiodomus TaxID=204799 RepID=A0A1H4JTL7_9HYPH|nr:ABC transporter permease [Nitratireductor aquibiodomus]EIM77004.1 oligopeptide transport system permease OppB [Nitratireductor aquibiodomus RA22]SEB49225.1 peptide/nickel transport system permease protein [Nitratireductor aquibiodomus]
MPAMNPTFAAYLLRGLAARLVVFGLVFVLMSVLPRLLPGDTFDSLMASDLVLGLDAGTEAALRERMGLSGGLWQQVGAETFAALRGELGFSLIHGAPVADILLGALPWTGLLVMLAVPLFLAMGLATGIEAGRAPGSRMDRAITLGMSVLASIPSFVMAVFLLLLFGIVWPVLPSAGAEPVIPAADPLERLVAIARHALLPAIALSTHELVRYFFILRSETILVSRRAFLVNARARGIGGWRERCDYFGRNLMAVVFARLGQSIATLLSAALYVEVIFAYPGIGRLMYQAVLDRDYPLLRGAIAVLAILVLLLNWIFDALTEARARRG